MGLEYFVSAGTEPYIYLFLFILGNTYLQVANISPDLFTNGSDQELHASQTILTYSLNQWYVKGINIHNNIDY